MQARPMLTRMYSAGMTEETIAEKTAETTAEMTAANAEGLGHQATAALVKIMK